MALSNEQILSAVAKLKKSVELTVGGISMLPVLTPGEKITVRVKDSYSPGDILVFLFRDEGFLVHRLLQVENGKYFCKGDNSFRLEETDMSSILGAVDIETDRNRTPEFIAASLNINRLLREMSCDVDTFKKTAEFQEYERRYLK